MKREKLVILILALMTLSGCGAGEKVIEGQVQNAQEGNETVASKDPGNGEEEGTTALKDTKGYAFSVKGISVQTDGDVAQYLPALGEPASYFEAASCAFDGLDKIYTYSGYVIKTYPQKDKDLVSSIILMDDSVSTLEGICIGSTKEAVISAYGQNYTEVGAMLVYEKDSCKLGFLVEDGLVTSIQYTSTVLDE